MDFLTFAALAALAMKFVDFTKYATNKDVNAVVTQLSVWAAGIVVIFLASAANIAQTIQVPGVGMALQDMDSPSKIIVGLGLLSAGSVLYDFKRAVDDSDSAVTPTLLPNSVDPNAVE